MVLSGVYFKPVHDVKEYYMDIWKTVSDNPLYEVSTKGHIRRIGQDKEKHLRSDARGYLAVDLYQGGNRETKKVHRLVAEAFIPNPEDKSQINHIDGNKMNNSVSNLEWVTPKENAEHACKNGIAKPSYGMSGKKNPNAGRKGIPFEIVETGEVFRTAEECAKKIDGNHRHINDCLRGRQKTHRGFHFRYI